MGLPAFANRNVLVMGLGRFGGGIGVTRWLCRAGANVTVTDLADGQALADSVQQLAGCNVFFHLGEHRTSDLDRVDLVVVSPAVDRRRSPFFAQVEARRIPWTTEINLFLSRCRGRVLGVTGTAGKSTTCALLHHALDGSLPKGRQAWFGGNVGRSLLNDLDDIGPDDVVVLELSSFQLETLPQIGTSPPIAAITNCWPNHLDRHADQAEYLAAKLNLFCHQQPGDHAVVPADDPGLVAAVEQVAARTGAQLVKFRLPTRPFDLRIPGRHNQHNAACAGTVARLLDLADAVIRNRMADFAGLPHRLEYVATTERGVACYNDSKATTPRGTATALEAFDQPVIVLLGGQDRGDDYAPLVQTVAARAKAAVCFGASGPVMAEAIRNGRREATGPAVVVVADLTAAFDKACDAAQPGEVILLSPGAPSYGEFVNYEHRGRVFAEQVRARCARQ